MSEFKRMIIDGSGFAKASYVPGERMLAHRFLGRVFAVRRDHPDGIIYVAWDGKNNAAERRKRFPEYKANRKTGKKSPFEFEEYLEQVTELSMILLNLGVQQAWSPGWEADDVIATLVRTSPGPALVLTRDKDLIQLAAEGPHTVMIRIGSKDHMLDRKAASAYLGMNVEVYRDWKALAGDGGDGVPGVKSIGAKLAGDLLEWHPYTVEDAIDGVLGRVDLPKDAKLSKKIERGLRLMAENPERLALMRWLVSLHTVPLVFRRVDPDEKEARRLFKMLGLRTLGARLRPEWFGEETAPPAEKSSPFELLPVKSSNISAVGVDAGDLVVKFNTGRTYRYPGKASHFQWLRAAPSAGRYFNQNLRATPAIEIGS